MTADLDMFGMPLIKRPVRGRHVEKPTAEQREVVRILRQGGATLDEIGREVGMATETMKRHFAEELHGLPHAPRSGRPSHEPSAASRAQVIRLRRAGTTMHRIAKALGISEPTLRRCYGSELGGCDRRARSVSELG